MKASNIYIFRTQVSKRSQNSRGKKTNHNIVLFSFVLLIYQTTLSTLMYLQFHNFVIEDNLFITFWTSKYNIFSKCLLSIFCTLYFSNFIIFKFRSLVFELPRFVCDCLQFTVVLFLMDGRCLPSNLPELFSSVLKL